MADRGGIQQQQQIPGFGSDLSSKRPLLPGEGNSMNNYSRPDRVPPNHAHDDYHPLADQPRTDGQSHVIFIFVVSSSFLPNKNLALN